MYKDAATEAEVFSNLMEELGISHKKFLAISDRGSDMIAVCKMLNMTRQNCIGHGLHNLINADVLPKTTIVKEFLKKLREILSIFRYKGNDIMIDFQLENDKTKAEYIENFSKIGKSN